MKKPVIVVTLWLAGLAFTFAGLELHAPYLFFVSRSDAGMIFVASLLVLAVLVRQKNWRGTGGKLLILLWCLPPASMLYAQTAFWLSKRNVPRTEANAANLLGQHFIIGYSSFAEVATLAEKGL